MGQREKTIQRGIITELEKRYEDRVWVRVKHGDAYAVVGDPDIYGCLHGWMFVLEVKDENGKLTKIQKHRLRQAYRAGALVGAVCSVEHAMEILHARSVILPEIGHL